MSTIRIPIGICALCGAKGFFIGGDKLEWTDISTEKCTHSLTAVTTGEPSPCPPPAEKPLHFPSENEAVYHACLKDLSHKCSGYIEKYDNDLDGNLFLEVLQNVYGWFFLLLLFFLFAFSDSKKFSLLKKALEKECEQSKQGIESQYNNLLDKLEFRHKTLVQELAHHKEKRQKELENLKSTLENYHESCRRALEKVKQTIQELTKSLHTDLCRFTQQFIMLYPLFIFVTTYIHYTFTKKKKNKSENDGPQREKKCQEIAGSTVKELPAIFDIPYHLKFDDQGVLQAQKRIGSYGNIAFTSLEAKKKIDQFVFRNSDQEWLKPWIIVALPSSPPLVNVSSASPQSSSQKYTRPPISKQSESHIIQSQSQSQSQMQKFQEQQNEFSSAGASSSSHLFSTVAPGSNDDVEDSKELGEFQFAVKKLEADSKRNVKIVFELNPSTLQVLENYKLILVWTDCANQDNCHEDYVDISKSRTLNDGMFEVTVPFTHEITGNGADVEGKLYDETNRKGYPLHGPLMQFGNVTFPKTVTQSSSMPSSKQSSESSKQSSELSKRLDPSYLQIIVEFEKEKKTVSLSKTNLKREGDDVATKCAVSFFVINLFGKHKKITSLQAAVAQEFGLEEPESVKFQSKTIQGNHTVEKRFDKDSMLNSFETSTQCIHVSLAKSDDKPGKLKLFLITSDNRRTKCIIKDLKITYADFKTTVQTKVRNCPDDFTIEIAGGKHQGKRIQKDEDMAYILSGEQEVELKIL
ncbi:hypothetical protein RFI_07561 [Reticulomyxa filosa]|uniref:Uncharacterized protein n=1 Tax=Reticulomyxa filosa TaxID=46433 RepID=X6NTF4_RETFI|nr:hypothetical protein RFI_07561 [Reticulomyxa filosa]|eukprot:ETO29560.1 hypothetical protein RFI_07561 [Reticulomyxa filosa]